MTEISEGNGTVRELPPGWESILAPMEQAMLFVATELGGDDQLAVVLEALGSGVDLARVDSVNKLIRQNPGVPVVGMITELNTRWREEEYQNGLLLERAEKHVRAERAPTPNAVGRLAWQGILN